MFLDFVADYMCEKIYLIAKCLKGNFYLIVVGIKHPVDRDFNSQTLKGFKEKRLERTMKLFDEYIELCKRNKITCEICCSENESVRRGLAIQISNLMITDILLEKSSRSFFQRVVGSKSISSYLRKNTPGSCSLYLIIGNGDLYGAIGCLFPPMEGVQDRFSFSGDLSVSSAESLYGRNAHTDLKSDSPRGHQVAGDQRQRGAVLSEANSTSSSNASSYQNELEELRAAENISRQKLEEEISMHTETKKELDNERRLRKIAEEKCASGESEAAFSGWRRVHNFWWKYSYEEIEGATENFNKMNKLGQGIYGQIYKGTLHHISVAVKVLAEEGIGDREEFHRKLELLSRLHHPHLVMLIGSCPDKACIIYEYMANGSLEERLYCKGGTPPLPWFTRFRICLEVARALLFLHSRPQPIAHRDLKLRNVLLDRGFVSKITDICVSDLVPMNNAAYTTIVREIMFTATLPYMDPHYLRTGIVSCEADVYALGILILQLLTKKPPLGIACVVEEALEHEQFYEMLDQSAGEWPLEEAMVVARLGLRCMEPKPKDRPKLEAGVLPVLESVQKPPGL
ncbi:hypothetical protein KP509_15G025100 [Ceratopteris richardii]|uniref:RING-type E3 ubiquitin transferase n=1 Tax=Ceratopteris richardii TaxID=49495 RepID=A0A8T2T1W0_CERRI|nr:hypothetical protein KP509_15G025100 [Ceratopteris richardii]